MKKQKKKTISKPKIIDISIPENYWQIIIAIITLILFSLNLVRIFDNVFWGDEAFSIKLMKMSIPEMLEATSNDVHPPLFYLLLMMLYRIFGTHGWVYHLSALLPYAILLVFSCTVFYKTFGKETTLLFNTFISLLFNCTVYNVEVRMYSLSALFLVLAFYGYYLIFENPESIRGYVIFTLFSLAVAYTHYFCIVSVSVFYIALLILFVMKKIKLTYLLAVYGITVAGYLPWFVILLKSVKRTSDNFWMTSTPSFQNSLLFIFYSKNIFFSVIMFIITIVFVVFLILDSPDYCYLLPCVLSAPVSIIVGNIVSALIRPVFINRYIYAASVLYCLALCITVARMNKKALITTLILVFTLFSCIPSYIETRRNEKNDDVKTAYTLDKIAECGIPEGTVLTNNDFFSWTVFEYYVPGTPCINVKSGFSDFKDNTAYYLAWNNALSDSENAWLSDNKYSAELIISDGFLGSNGFYIYRLIHNN